MINMKQILLLLCLAAGVPAFADGIINIAQPDSGSGWTFSGNVVTISANGIYTVTGSSTTNRVVINKNVTATVTLQNANIHSAVASPFALSSDNTGGSQVTLILSGTNELVSTEILSAGLTVEDSARITVEGNGSLLAAGGGLNPRGGAGIGGGHRKSAGTIIIQSGTVTATGGEIAAAIGGGGQRYRWSYKNRRRHDNRYRRRLCSRYWRRLFVGWRKYYYYRRHNNCYRRKRRCWYRRGTG
ncbi:MAG: hypothetical protein MdMp024_0416 [Bacteroidales bacterium]